MLVLEEYRFSKANQQGVLWQCFGARFDYEFNSPCPRLLTQGPRSNFEIGGGGGTISDSILGGAQDTFSY